MRGVTTNSSLLFSHVTSLYAMTKNYKPTIFRFVYINMIKIAIFHVYGRYFVFQNGRRFMQIFKKIPNNYFGSHYKYLGHKYIVIQ